MSVLLGSRFLFLPFLEVPREVGFEIQEHILHRAKVRGYCTKVQYLLAEKIDGATFSSTAGKKWS